MRPWSYVLFFHIHNWPCLVSSPPHVIHAKCEGLARMFFFFLLQWLKRRTLRSLELNVSHCDLFSVFFTLSIRKTKPKPLGNKNKTVKKTSPSNLICTWEIQITAWRASSSKRVKLSMRAQLSDEYSTQQIWSTNRFGLSSGKHTGSMGTPDFFQEPQQAFQESPKSDLLVYEYYCHFMLNSEYQLRRYILRDRLFYLQTVGPLLLFFINVVHLLL